MGVRLNVLWLPPTQDGATHTTSWSSSPWRLPLHESSLVLRSQGCTRASLALCAPAHFPRQTVATEGLLEAEHPTFSFYWDPAREGRLGVRWEG